MLPPWMRTLTWNLPSSSLDHQPNSILMAGGVRGRRRSGQRKLGDDSAGVECTGSAFDAENAKGFLIELDHERAARRGEGAGVDDDVRRVFCPDAGVVDVAEDDEAGGRVVSGGHRGGGARGGHPCVQHREWTTWVYEDTGEAGELVGETAIGRIVFGRKANADRAEDAVTGFEAVPFAGWKRIAQCVDAAAVFGETRAPRREVFKKNVAVREPDLAVGEKEFVRRGDVGVVVAGDEGGFARVGGEEIFDPGDQFRAVGGDLGIKRVTVDDDAVSSLEQRTQHRQGSHLAGGVVVVKI